jgi:hypothetical protein
MHGSGEITNPLAVLMGGRHAAGFYRPGHFCPDPERFVEWRDDEHEVLRYLRLMERLGVPARGSALEFPLHDRDWSEWLALGLPRDGYAVVHPGSQLPSRRWPAERFAAVADALSQAGLQVVLTGTDGEAGITGAVKAKMRCQPLGRVKSDLRFLLRENKEKNKTRHQTDPKRHIRQSYKPLLRKANLCDLSIACIDERRRRLIDRSDRSALECIRIQRNAFEAPGFLFSHTRRSSREFSRSIRRPVWRCIRGTGDWVRRRRLRLFRKIRIEGICVEFFRHRSAILRQFDLISSIKRPLDSAGGMS